MLITITIFLIILSALIFSYKPRISKKYPKNLHKIIIFGGLSNYFNLNKKLNSAINELEFADNFEIKGIIAKDIYLLYQQINILETNFNIIISSFSNYSFANKKIYKTLQDYIKQYNLNSRKEFSFSDFNKQSDL